VPGFGGSTPKGGTTASDSYAADSRLTGEQFAAAVDLDGIRECDRLESGTPTLVTIDSSIVGVVRLARQCECKLVADVELARL
jgi:hypothetical protein